MIMSYTEEGLYNTLTVCYFIGDGPDMRDYVTECGVAEPLLRLVQTDTNVRPHIFTCIA